MLSYIKRACRKGMVVILIKRLILASSLTLLLSLPACCSFGSRTLSFNDITSGLYQSAAEITDKNGHPVDFSSLSGYTDKQYTRYSGKLGNTARRSFCFYDDKGKLLFTLTDLGNNDLILISIDQKDHVYQYK